jgi:hypothetical protein
MSWSGLVLDAGGLMPGRRLGAERRETSLRLWRGVAALVPESITEAHRQIYNADGLWFRYNYNNSLKA